jgi:hypothetical protein
MIRHAEVTGPAKAGHYATGPEIRRWNERSAESVSNAGNQRSGGIRPLILNRPQ